MMQGLSRKTRSAMRRSRRKRAAMVNIVPMIDVLTVLVFFLLMNVTGVSVLGVTLPSASATPPKQPTHPLTVTIHPNNLVVADDRGLIRQLPRLADGHYDLPGLSTLLWKIKQRMPQQDRIILLMEPNTPYNSLVEVMDTVRARVPPGGFQTLQMFPDVSLGDAAPENAGVQGGSTTPADAEANAR